ncbi:alpha/beta hydrolase [Luteimonas sp. FCS-9]|uniref:alpha/beta hydrolase family protein n=1 Tax=Luteimonas sp. FCS-9 TaxID=1547516 RepID=UPI00063E71C3|nr:alpha/beta hydrolase [Luteimonas sp. FCS-9]KLJ00319.1 hypothetical protein WQ56_09630 [Luteimonas sp. FCS-9]
MSTASPRPLPQVAGDGHRYELIACVPASPRRSLLWLPAMGVPARHYLPFAERLAAHDVAVFLHEWRGIGSSALRAGRRTDWGYRDLLVHDIACSDAAMRAAVPGVARAVGGHSLGGQLACCHLACRPHAAQALWLVASGAPYWRAFPAPRAFALPPLYRFMAWLSRVNGVLPGRRLGFGGNEARGVIADWTRSGLSGRYGAAGLDLDLDAGLRRVDVPVRAAVLADDWLGPASSLRCLLGKLATRTPEVATFDATALGARADHFAWMRQPDAIADWLARA